MVELRRNEEWAAKNCTKAGWVQGQIWRLRIQQVAVNQGPEQGGSTGEKGKSGSLRVGVED